MSQLRGLSLQGLSQEDRDLMLAMMAALGSAATTMIATGTLLNSYAKGGGDSGEMPDPIPAMKRLDTEANAMIELIKACKDRLKPGHAIILPN